MFDILLHESLSDRQLLIALNKRMHDMALDLTKLTAAVTRNTAAVDALIASHATATDPAVQAAVDAQAAALDVESAKAEAAVAPPTTAPAS